MSLRISDEDQALYRQLNAIIGPIVENEMRSWRYHIRTMATTDPDGLLPEQSGRTVSSSITREVAQYLTPWIRGRSAVTTPDPAS